MLRRNCIQNGLYRFKAIEKTYFAFKQNRIRGIFKKHGIMKITKTCISGLVIIEPKIFDDSRGYFYEPYNKSNFDKSW